MQPLNPLIASQIADERRLRAGRARSVRSERPALAFLARRRAPRRDAAPTGRPAVAP